MPAESPRIDEQMGQQKLTTKQREKRVALINKSDKKEIF